MAFHDVVFPTGIALGASAGPKRKTDIITYGSGREQRNARWANARRQFNAAYGVKTIDDLYEVIAFFEERQGRLHSFRFRDPFDHKSCKPGATPTPFDQRIGEGDGTMLRFELVKAYGQGETAISRRITRPRPESLQVAVADQVLVPGTDFFWDDATFQLVFSQNSVPGAGQVITAGFHFDVPVRFDSDEIITSMSHFQAGEIPAIPLVEVLP